MEYYIGIDLGGSSVKAVAVTPEGETLSKQNVDFDTAEKMHWANCVAAIIQDFESEGGSPATGIGLSAPGLVGPNPRAVTCMPGRLEGLVGLDWTEFLKRDRIVPVMNDGHAAIMGEAWLGAGRGCQNLFMLTLGTGVGGAAIANGKLLLGHLGRGGHLGHISLDPEGEPDICGTPGSLEDAVGNCTIEKRSQGRFKTTHELIAAHEAGEAEASRIWLKSIKDLAAGIAGLINVLDPEAVIVGGGIARAGETLFKPLQERLNAMEWRPTGTQVRIVPAELGELAGAHGAAYGPLWTARTDGKP